MPGASVPADAGRAADTIELQPFYYETAPATSRPASVVVGSRYFWEQWAPRLGPTLTVLIVRLRMHCYYNQRTQERRDWCFPTQQTLAKEIGVSRWTVMRELKKPLARRFVRAQYRSRWDPARRQTIRISSLYHVAMDDPLVDGAHDAPSPPPASNTAYREQADCPGEEQPKVAALHLTGQTAERLLTAGVGVQPAMGPGWSNVLPKEAPEKVADDVADVARELVQERVSRRAAERLAQDHPAELIREKLTLVRQLANEKGALRNAPGFLRRAIEENYQLQPTGTECPARSGLLQLRMPAPALGAAARMPREETIGAPPRASARLRGDDVWERAKSTLRAEMTAAAYEQWVETTTLLHYEPGKLRIAAPDTHVQRYLQRRLARAAEAALRAICGEPTALEVCCGMGDGG